MKQTVPAEGNPWDISRKLIEHEDNLVNHRLTWLLTMHGFLFAALAVAANAIVTQKQDRGTLLWWIMFGVAVVGFLSPWFVWTSLQSAFQQLRTVTRWWKGHWAERVLIGETHYPMVRGLPWNPHPAENQPVIPQESWTHRLSRRLSPGFNPRNIPIMLSLVWLGFIIVVFAYSAPKPEPAGSQKVTVTGPDGKSMVTIELGSK